jgi:hypothetical protein
MLTGFCCRQPVNITHYYINCCLYGVDSLDDEQQARSKHVEAYYLNKSIENILEHKSQRDAHVTEFILSDNCYTCFGRHYHLFQQHKTTVTTASGNLVIVVLCH